MIVTAGFFYLFAALTIASGFMVIASRNPVQSVLFLILAFVNAAGLFLMMGAEFLAMILVVVYVGAVAVLFLFVVMMLDVDFAALREGALQYLPMGVLIGVIFAILFMLGVFGIFLNRKNVIVILMSIELILLAVNINFVAFSTHLNDIVGQVFALIVLTVAAAEAAIGLAILVVFFRNRGSIEVEDVNMMRG